MCSKCEGCWYINLTISMEDKLYMYRQICCIFDTVHLGLAEFLQCCHSNKFLHQLLSTAAGRKTPNISFLSNYKSNNCNATAYQVPALCLTNQTINVSTEWSVTMVNIGTTHFVNALVQRVQLARCCSSTLWAFIRWLWPFR